MKTFYSIRAIRAKNLSEAIEKTENNEFDEENELCDKVIEENELFASWHESICKAVNNYDKLREDNAALLNALKSTLDDWHSKDSNFNKKEPKYLHLVRAAIQKAESK